MVQSNQIYKCSVCGNIVEVVHVGGGELSCCGQPMVLQVENSVDAAIEKHVPIVEREGDFVRVKVGSVPHPMEDAHYIECIEVLADGRVERKYLNPGDEPQADFEVPTQMEVTARAYCNLHGLWKS